MAGFYGRGGPSSSMQAPYGRGAATGDAPQPQPQPAIRPPSTSQPSVTSGEHPLPSQAQPSSPQVHCSIPVASIFRFCLNNTISFSINSHVFLIISEGFRAERAYIAFRVDFYFCRVERYFLAD